MDRTKKIMSLLKADQVLVKLIRQMIGRHEEPSKIFELQSKLVYVRVEEECDQVVMSDRLSLCADKVDRIKKLIKQIRDQDYEICKYLNSVSCELKEKQVVVVKKISEQVSKRLYFSGVREFEHIKEEIIPIVLSVDRVIDLVKMPHLLVAGMTGSGKSVFLNVVILSILSKLGSDDCKLVLIDPKRVEFSVYRGLENLYRPVASKVEDVEKVLSELVDEMDRRYEKLESFDVKNIGEYNKSTTEKMPYLVVVIDELADLMLVSDHGVEVQITRLAQLARAVGIHLVMATQRPVVEIMTGLIKANMPARISFRVASKQDSRVILDETGAEVLKGAGEGLLKVNGKVERFQGIWIDDEQIKKIVKKV